MVAGKLEKFVEKKEQNFTLPEPVNIRKIEDLSPEELEDLKIKAIQREPTETSSMMLTTDSKCNYICGSKGSGKDLDRFDEIISTEKLDYNIVSKDKEEESKSDTKDLKKDIQEGVIDKRDSLSYMSINSVEEGEDWYRNNFPKVPEDLYPLMARWSFGDLSEVTKKSMKNKKKKDSRKKNKEEPGLQVKQGNFVVKF